MEQWAYNSNGRESKGFWTFHGRPSCEQHGKNGRVFSTPFLGSHARLVDDSSKNATTWANDTPPIKSGTGLETIELYYEQMSNNSGGLETTFNPSHPVHASLEPPSQQ